MDDVTFTIEPNGVKGSFADGCDKNTVEIPGVDGTYEALQFHIHTSSEHTIDDKFYNAELHIVHQGMDDQSDRYAVVGMMIDGSAQEDNPMFADFLEGWTDASQANRLSCRGSASTSTTRADPVSNDGGRKLQSANGLGFNVYDLLPDDVTFYHYDGSLTTPPCSEVVWWNLADKPVMISVRQYVMMTVLMMQFRDENCDLMTIASPAGTTARPTQPLNGRTIKRICPANYSSNDDTSNRRKNLRM